MLAVPAPNSPSPSPSDPPLPLPLPLPPLPPPPPPPPPPPQPQKHVTPLSLYQIVISKQAHVNSETRTPKSTPKIIRTKISTKQEPILRQTRPRRTNPLVWCGAILCLVFSLILIFFGIATLIIFLVVRPKVPLFDTTNARLSTVYFDSPEYLNGDFTFLANFSNPNRKLDIRFEYLAIELYFADRLISTQSLQQFTQRPREMRLESVHMISSLVYLPQSHAVELRTQVQSNRVNYNIRATFKVRATLGMLHFTYWLHSRCQLQMTGPPTGILVARRCRTNR